LSPAVAQHADALSNEDKAPVLPNAMYLGRHFSTNPLDPAHVHFSVREAALGSSTLQEMVFQKQHGGKLEAVEAVGSPNPHPIKTTHESSPAILAANRGWLGAIR